MFIYLPLEKHLPLEIILMIQKNLFIQKVLDLEKKLTFKIYMINRQGVKRGWWICYRNGVKANIFWSKDYCNIIRYVHDTVYY